MLKNDRAKELYFIDANSMPYHRSQSVPSLKAHYQQHNTRSNGIDPAFSGPLEGEDFVIQCAGSVTIPNIKVINSVNSGDTILN